MSEWLQNIGKSQITAGDISDTDYAELDRLEFDNVKAVNEANDNFIKGIEEQAVASINFYKQAYANKFAQYKSLADLSKTAAEVVPQVLELNDSRIQYDKAFSFYKNKEVDPESINQENDEKVITNAAAAAKRLTGSGAIKADAETIWDIETVDGRLTDLLDSRDESYKLGGVYLNNWYEVARYEKIPIPEELGGGERSLNDAQADSKLFRYIQKELGIIYLNEARAAGYSDRFLRRYVAKNLFQKQELEFNEQQVALGKALAVESERLSKTAFFQKIKSGYDANDMDSTVIGDTITELAGPNPTRAELVRARQIIFGWLTDGRKTNDLKTHHIKYIGKEQIRLRSSTPDKPIYQAISDDKLWGSEFQVVLNASLQLDTNDINIETNANEALNNKTNNNLLTAAREHGIRSPEFKDALDLAKTEWDTNNPGQGYSPTILNYMYQRSNPVLSNDIEEKLTNNLTKGVYADSDYLISQLPEDRQGYWKERIKHILPVGYEQKVAALTQQVFIDLEQPLPEGWSLRAALDTADGLFKDGYDAYILSTVGVDIPEETRIKNATAAGLDNLETKMTDLLEKNSDHFVKLGLPSDEQKRLTVALDDVRKIIQKTPGIITSEELIAPNEKLLLEAALPYIKGEVNEPPDAWRILAKYSNTGLNAHDLITARLEATGMLPEGIKPQYSGENGSASLYVTPGGSYRIILGSQYGDNTHLEFAEAIGHLQVNANNGGYDYHTENGRVIKSDTPLSKMTFGDVINLSGIRDSNNDIVDVRSGIRLGMYDLSAGQILNIADMLSRNDPSRSYMDRPFDQDLQDELIFLSFRLKLDKNKTLKGASSQQWAQTLNISEELAKELKDVYPMLINTPYLQIKHLLPDVAKALLLELSGTQ